MNQKGFTPLVVILGIIVVLGVAGGIYYLGRTQSEPSSQTKINIPIKSVNMSQNITDSKQALVSLQKVLGTTSPIREGANTDWLDQNKQRVPLIGQDFALGTSANTYVGKYGNYEQYPNTNFLKDITEDSFKPLQATVEELFSSSGFQKDNQNTFRNEGLVYLSMGYQKGNIKCLITLTPQTDPFGNFFCGVIDETQIVWRKELVPVINPKNDPNLSVQVSKLQGNYATGGAGSYGGGYVWYAVKVDGKWKEVWTGQDIISCKPVKQYSIPKEIYSNDCSIYY